MVASTLSHSLALTEGRDHAWSHFQFSGKDQRPKETQNILTEVNSVLAGAQRVVW